MARLLPFVDEPHLGDRGIRGVASRSTGRYVFRFVALDVPSERGFRNSTYRMCANDGSEPLVDFAMCRRRMDETIVPMFANALHVSDTLLERTIDR